MTTHKNATNSPTDFRDAVAEDLMTGVAAVDGFNLSVNTSDINAFVDAQSTTITPDISENSSATKPPPGKWYGSDSRQAIMQFTAYLLYKNYTYTGPVSGILSDPKQRKYISRLIDWQLKHMFGVFTTHPDFVNNPGVPSSAYTVNLLGAENVRGGHYANYTKISYSYDDIMVFSKSLLSGSGPQRIKFVLPKDPVTIYKKGLADGKNLCTDEHYNAETDFWYFWNPYQRGCPIDDEDLVTVQAHLKPIDITRGGDTYPEYTRLYGGGEALQVTYLASVNKNFEDEDAGKQNFQNAFLRLCAAGFEVTMDEPYHKRLSFFADAKRTSVDMRLMDPNSWEFGEAAAHGMETADIFLYDGHSGLGGNLNITYLSQIIGRPLTLPKKYQIFFFRGCSTYAYYNSAYFELKRSDSDPNGTKNLDIITTGIGASFIVGAKTDVDFLTSIAFGQRPSWQTIIDTINTAEGRLSALTHVNGDEDNPRTP
ncbi:MAG: hypothetical protein ABIG11_04560 [bacterium]